MAYRSPLSVPLIIHEFSPEGFGRGSWQKSEEKNFLVDVPFTMPGDSIEAELFKAKKNYQGRLKQLVHPSPDRILPRCIHFGVCGGCRWQHIGYDQQLKMKEEQVRTLLTPLADEQTLWHPIIPCTPPWNYRNKMELTFSADKYQKRYLGLFLQGTRGHVFQMEECHLAQPWIPQAVKVVSEWWESSGLEAYHPNSNKGSLRTLTLRSGIRTGDRMVILLVSGDPDYAIHKSQLNALVSQLQQMLTPFETGQSLSIFLRIQQIVKGQRTQFYEMLLAGPDHIREILYLKNEQGILNPLHFQLSPTAFFQPNTQQAEQLYTRAIELSQLSKESVVYDLYCGTGTLGICLAKHVKEILGIELSPESVLDARENIKLNHISNLVIETGDVGKVLAQWKKEKKPFPDVVMVDPPRAGLDTQAIQHLLELNPPCLTYISCNPITQTTNLECFINSGYRLHAVQPVDQFPQTIHVENIVILKR
jgi:23S rRNA (uracil1939-C5)-methyltransferase